MKYVAWSNEAVKNKSPEVTLCSESHSALSPGALAVQRGELRVDALHLLVVALLHVRLDVNLAPQPRSTMSCGAERRRHSRRI